eukprot:TRINITY_DN5854_c0_g2_i2.p1 TRINITY_DN5854_c0_g2~~TRINITY_DN5854_c0_g2_i2.p1  ORF type:complete len:721 (+),score=199.81 TRINITY_DN5854_c0_g2_i2:102-2165(+)
MSSSTTTQDPMLSHKEAPDVQKHTAPPPDQAMFPSSYASIPTSTSSPNNDVIITHDQVKQTSTEKRTLESLHFDNIALHSLPIDRTKENYVRRNVPDACWSIVSPSPLSNPRTVCVCPSALALLDLDVSESKRPDFAEYLTGNKLFPGAEPAAHCYCGFQFGNFAGQLGDGRAMYLGEVVNSKGERWELQFKGAGKTPYSRDADGRAVLRSSIREFLCSEALFYLGIPTTRAATVVTSDTKVIRDLKYTGNPIQERATVVLRIASTFLRFGSYQICLPEDRRTGRAGPSHGNTEIISTLLDYTIKNHFPSIYSSSSGAQRVEEFYREVVKRTARLVADWQCVGFAHGVLNTDNMSIAGLTIDYGPFGFMDYYDPNFICNGSDHEGRYAFQNQPSVCQWNLKKLGEALEPHLHPGKASEILNEYRSEYETHYYKKMHRKLGLLDEQEGDTDLIDKFLDTMAITATDFTNSFRILSRIAVHKETPENGTLASDDVSVLDYLLTQAESAAAIAQRNAPKIPKEKLTMLMMLAQQNPAILNMLGIQGPEALEDELSKHEEFEKNGQITEEQKQVNDREQWTTWLLSYRLRLQRGISNEKLDNEEELKKMNSARVQIMNSTNPKFVLRNYLAQNAIAKAEEGDYSEVESLLLRLHDPYAKDEEVVQQGTGAVCKYSGKRPGWAGEICVTCSS